MQKKVPKTGIYASVALIMLIGFAVYANSLNGEFIWDDEFLIRDNSYIKHYSNLPRIFAEDWGGGAGKAYNFYRPLCIVTYFVNYSLGKLDVRGYHLANALFHVFAALALYWFVMILANDGLFSFFAALFFVAHPVHTEAVAYISGRVDSITFLFLFLSLIFYIKYLHSSGNIVFCVLAPLSFALALLSKENSLILPALILLYSYAFKKRLKRDAFISILLVGFLYVGLRAFVLKSLEFNVSLGTILQRVPGFFAAIFGYIRLLVFPFGLHMEYGNELFGFGDPRVALGFIASAAPLFYAVKKRRQNSLVFFSVFWFFIALLPVSNLYPVSFYMAEHYLYLPSVGFFLLLAKGLSSAYRLKNIRVLSSASAVILLVFYSSLTIRQNIYWKEPLSFYERTLRFSPESWRVRHNFAISLKRRGKKEEAMASYKKAILLNPDFTGSYNNLALLYAESGQREKAIFLLEQAIKRKPDFVTGYNSLGVIYKRSGEKDKAIALYKKAIEINPYYADAYNNLGYIYATSGDHGKALVLFEKAAQINPYYADAYTNMGSVYARRGIKERAKALFEKAVKIDPDHALAHNNLAALYCVEGRYDLAAKHCDMAQELGYAVTPELSEFIDNHRKTAPSK